MDQLPPPPYPSLITTALIVVSAVFPVVSAISILLRVAARYKSRHGLHADDYWIIGSWFLTLPLSILVWVYAGKSGINYYNVDFLTGTEASLELIFISSCYVQFPLAAVKIAVLLFYKRIFTTPVFKTCIWFAIGIITLWGFIFFFLVLLEIDPVAFPLTAVALRLDSTAIGLAQVASSFTLDIIVLCLPLPVISRLNMKSKRKFAVAMIFWLGAFCVVTAIVRTVLLDQSIREVVGSTSYDHVASQSKQYIFMVLEPNCSILAACMPTYGPLMAGGRGPESIIRSVRSIFSLRSVGSGGSRPSRRNYVESTSNMPRGSSAAESQVELQGVETWPGKGQQEVRISGKLSNEAPPLPALTNHKAIYVTNNASVHRE
ncbi:hypothetical protein QBC46DRAFT_308347 [Diplogelasinospora grovesii]|uniref:Rhodopsin domain-containing protein n=1 Tax=Diplogelasinospora grovesii TaxID=303347 RepID=A0AAN6S728_9PEZI|nr:hypothetical protein QBC46DRAFT_308347 [Diplogelasinospora grovesii]